MKAFLESRACVMLLLFIGLLVFSVSVIYCAIKLPANDRIFFFLVAVANNFSGSFFTILRMPPSQNGPTQG